MLIFERLAATIFRSDYEHRKRTYIAVILLSLQYVITIGQQISVIQEMLGNVLKLTRQTFNHVY